MDVIMPQLGETVLEGNVVNWYKKVGDTVTADESLFDVETDKVTTEIPAPVSGVLTEILVGAGVTVKVGTRLAVIESASSSVRKTTPNAPALPPAAPAAADRSVQTGNVVAPPPSLRNSAGGARLSPVVRRLLGEHGIVPEKIHGRGAGGRITREDVLAYVQNAAAQTAAASAASPASRMAAVVAQTSVAAIATSDTPTMPLFAARGSDDLVIPLNRIRRLTAAHMVRSKTITPHAVQAVEVDFHAVDKARKAVGAQWKAREGYSLTYLPFIACAVCEAIAKFPYVNSSFGDDELIVHKRVHMGIAVDLSFDGLVATVVRDAHHRNLRGLATEINRLAAAARSNQLKPDDLTGGTYTISNSGSFGTFFSTSIINQPQTAILSTDGVRKKPVVLESDDGDVIAIRPIGILAQSFDHRAFDGAYSAAFLRCLKDVIETCDWIVKLS